MDITHQKHISSFSFFCALSQSTNTWVYFVISSLDIIVLSQGLMIEYLSILCAQTVEMWVPMCCNKCERRVREHLEDTEGKNIYMLSFTHLMNIIWMSAAIV